MSTEPHIVQISRRDRALFLSGITAYATWYNGDKVVGPTKLRIEQIRAELDLGMYDEDIRSALKTHKFLEHYMNPTGEEPDNKPPNAPVVWNRAEYITKEHLLSAGKMNSWVIRHMADSLGINTTRIKSLMKIHEVEIPHSKLITKKKKNGTKSTKDGRPNDKGANEGPRGFPHASSNPRKVSKPKRDGTPAGNNAKSRG